MSDAADREAEPPRGTALLADDLTEEQLAAAPVLASVEGLIIGELDENEDDAFADALRR